MARYLLVGGMLLLFGCQENSIFEVTELPAIILPINKHPQNAEELIDQLGCQSCHAGVSTSKTLKTKAPDLSHAGLQYQPNYLFNYLQNPERVRNHIGSARMPDFGFSKKESLALTIYLESLNQINEEWPEFPKLSSVSDNPEKGEEIFNQLSCNACHSMNGDGNAIVSDLSNSAMKFNEPWLKKFLIAPHIFRGEENIMPSYFYTINEGSFVENMPDASHGIQWIVDFLLYANKEEGSTYEDFKKENPDITREQGEKIFKVQNCVACHRSNISDNGRTAPDLNIESMRVTKHWLDSFLANPYAIRPFGYPAGRGNRMPDFHLNEDEREMISKFLIEMDADTETVTKLSAYKISKTESLILNKLSCTGCHTINGSGGKIGPDLSQVPNRLNPDYVRQLLDNPHQFDENIIMPIDPLTKRWKEDIVSFLFQQEKISSQSTYLSLIDNEPLTMVTDASYENQYRWKCAICHGVTGDGNGYNAKFMEVKPTDHSDGAYMSQRADDTMFDGIYNGGYYLNKSNQMPGWGQSLTMSDISGLVDYMRQLCNCEGPEWSRDGYEAK